MGYAEPVAKLRITDLARMAGVSVQQVRNYVELGVLPPVERTASGYRVFTEVHAEALLIVRQLAEGHGWERTRTIMRAVHAGDLGTVLATVDASHGELDRERSDIARVLGAFDEIGREPHGRQAEAAAADRRGGGRGRGAHAGAAAVGAAGPAVAGA